MRKRDPNAVVDQFQAELAASLDDWRATRELVGQGGALAQRASMDAFTRSAVGFERFRSEWHIAAIARDAARFRATQRDRVVAALEETGRDQLVPYLPMGMGIDVHPTLDDVAAMLDATGGNISIPTIKQWKKLATRHLCDPWKSKVMGLSWEQAMTTAAVIALRNAASHQSPVSAGRLNQALDGLTHPVDHAGLQRAQRGVSVAKIATYLNGAADATSRRVERYHILLDAIGESLRVP